MVLCDASFPNVGKKPHVPKVDIFVHIRVEFRLPEDTSAMVIKSWVYLLDNKLRPIKYLALKDNKRKSRRGQA